MIGWMPPVKVAAVVVAAVSTFAFGATARAQALPETCPAVLTIPVGTAAATHVGTTHVGLAISAASARTVSGDLTIRTDHGWFTAAFPAEKLQPAALQFVNGLKAIRIWHGYMSPILYLNFSRPVSIVSMWISDARATGDSVGWAEQGTVSCDPPQGDPLHPFPPMGPKYAQTLVPSDLARFEATPSQDASLTLRSVTPLNTSCPHPFTDATATHPVSPKYPFAGSMPAGTTLIEVLIGHDGSALATSVMHASGIDAFDIAARQSAEASTYAPATAYCKPIISRYLVRADFNPR